MTKFFRYTKIAIGTVMDIMSAAADGVLTIAEVIEICKKMLHRILPDAPEKDIAGFSVLTSAAQYQDQAANFTDEDVAVIIPAAIMTKLKIAMTP